MSPEAQAVLARPVNLAGALGAVPSTAEEWRAQREATEARIFRPMIAKALEATGVRVEKREIAGVTVRVLTPPPPREPIAGRILMNLHGGAYTIGGGDVSIGEGGIAMFKIIVHVPG